MHQGSEHNLNPLLSKTHDRVLNPIFEGDRGLRASDTNLTLGQKDTFILHFFQNF